MISLEISRDSVVPPGRSLAWDNKGKAMAGVLSPELRNRVHEFIYIRVIKIILYNAIYNGMYKAV